MMIGILTHNPNSYFQQRLTEEGTARGHSMRYIQISHCYMNISSTAPTVYYRSNETFDDLDAIIPRINPKQTSYGTAVLRQFEMMGVFSLNTALSVTWSRDKLRAFQILARKQLPMPITGFADSPEETEKLIDVVGGTPLIVRLLEGVEGKGTVFAETPQAAISVINAFKQLKTNILVQEYVQEAQGNDIRCVVVGNKVIASIQRGAIDMGFRNHRYPPLISPIKITAIEKKMAIQAAKSMKLNLASVDLIRSNRGPLVLDIDSSPNLELLEKTTHIDIASPILQFIEENVKSRD